MIRIIVGKPGAGKTLFVVRELFALRRRDPRRRIVSNIPLSDTAMKALSPYYHISDLKGGGRFWENSPGESSIYLDEGQLLFDAKDFAELHRRTPELRAYLSHIRHFRDELTVISHDVGHIDKRIRDLASVFVWMRSTESILRVMGLKRPSWVPQIFFASTYYDPDMTERMGFTIFRGSSELYESYDSYSLRDMDCVRRLDVSSDSSLFQTEANHVEVRGVGSGSFKAVEVLIWVAVFAALFVSF